MEFDTPFASRHSATEASQGSIGSTARRSAMAEMSGRRPNRFRGTRSPPEPHVNCQLSEHRRGIGLKLQYVASDDSVERRSNDIWAGSPSRKNTFLRDWASARAVLSPERSERGPRRRLRPSRQPRRPRGTRRLLRHCRRQGRVLGDDSSITEETARDWVDQTCLGPQTIEPA